MNRVKRAINRILIVITALVSAAVLLPAVNANAAAGQIDLSKKGTLTVTHINIDGELVEGVHSHIYRVASVNEYRNFTVLSPFDEISEFSLDELFSVDIQAGEEWTSYVNTVKAYIEANGIAPYAEGISDSEGKTYYTDLELGIYLVLSDDFETSDAIHSFINFFVDVPRLEEDADGNPYFNYDVAASPKKSKVSKGESADYSVYKRWSDSGYESNRPSSITVEIYCNGALYDTVTLSASNNWSYSWTEQAGYSWSLVETSSGSNYSASLSSDGYVFVFTNTYNPPDEPETPDTPNTPDTPETPDTPNTPGIPDIPSVLGAFRDLPAVLGARRLPQTGQLWWPLPILIIAGIVLIIKGIRKILKNNSI